jgi:hypothetical protein
MKRRILMSDEVLNERTSGDSRVAKRCSVRQERWAILRASGWREEREVEAPFEAEGDALPRPVEEEATKAHPSKAESRRQPAMTWTCRTEPISMKSRSQALNTQR